MPTLDAAARPAPLPGRLPRVDVEEAHRRADLLQRLAGGRTAEGLTLRARLDPPPPAGPALRFACGIGAAPVVVDGRPALWTAAAASPALPEVLAEFSRLEPLLAAVEAALGLPLDPQGLAPAFGAGLAAEVQARDGAGHTVYAMTLVLGREVVFAPSPRPSSAPVPLGAAAKARTAVRLVVDGPSAPAAELGGLARGDLLPARGRDGGGLRARLAVAGGRGLRGIWRPGDGRFTGDDMDDAFEAATAQGEPLAAPGDLPVRLQFELAAVDLPLAEVAALAPGAVVGVPASGDSPVVTVLAGGARLARGRLVALGDGYGVVIDEVAGAGAGAISGTISGAGSRL